MTTTIPASHSPYVRTGRHRSWRPRTLSLVDLENLVGGIVDAPLVHDMWTEFIEVTDARFNDHSTVAVAARNFAPAFFALPGNIHRVVGADLPDGADLALLDAIDINWAANQFGQVMIASGDHAFTPMVHRLRDAGLTVIQVIGAGRCANDLYQACQEHRYLPRTRAAVQRRKSEHD